MLQFLIYIHVLRLLIKAYQSVQALHDNQAGNCFIDIWLSFIYFHQGVIGLRGQLNDRLTFHCTGCRFLAGICIFPSFIVCIPFLFFYRQAQNGFLNLMNY